MCKRRGGNGPSHKLLQQPSPATNLLENMIKKSQPTRAESHDIYSSLKGGAKGLVLAAESAIGKNPLACVKFLKRYINVFEKNKKEDKNYLFRSTT